MDLSPEGTSNASSDNEDNIGYRGIPGSYGYSGGSSNYGTEGGYRSGERSGGDDSDRNIVSGSSGPDRCNGKKKKSDQPMLKIWRKEVDVGITEYLGAHKGFFAIIKQRCSDFHVNEVNAQGDVIHLTDESVPDPPKEKVHIVTEGVPACIPEEKIAEIEHMFGIHSKLTKENMIFEKDKNIKKLHREVFIKVDGLEKQERASIHLFIKTHYKKVMSSTKEINGEKYIQVRRGINEYNWNNKTTWPKSQQYTYFVLYKEDMATIDAISKIAFKLRLKPAMFIYAGTKDKRAKTSQVVSVPEVSPQRLYNVTKDNWAIKVGNFSFHHKPLKLGQLCGNRFKLVLRKISVSDEVVNDAVESLKCLGFINYYGMHRFGTTCVSTLSIGRALLQGNWTEAINLILTPRNDFGEGFIMFMALQEYQKNGNVKEALHKLNECDRGNSIEAQLLKGISECDKDDLVGALSRLPRNVQCLYLHAYQSFIWNSIASRRMKEFGFRVLPGDLVKRQPASSIEKFLEDANETIDAEDSTKIYMTQEETEDENSEEKENGDIHILTAEEANNTDITQVLLPLPGHNILLPDNEIKNWYVEMLEKDGLSLEKLKHNVKTFSVSGMYRHLVVRPSDVSHSITYYNDVSKHLIQSDKEKLKGEDVEKNKLDSMPGIIEGKPLEPMDVDGPLPSILLNDTNLNPGTKESTQSIDQKEKSEGVKDDSIAMEEESAGGYGYGASGCYDIYAQQRVDMTKGRMKALILELTLPAACYATMAIRELLKIDTSTQFQNILDPGNAKMKLGCGRGNFGRRTSFRRPRKRGRF